MKWLIRSVVVVVLVLVVGLGVAYLYLNSIAKQAVERGGTYATGVPTTVDSMNVSLFGGEIGIDGLTIANPEGYSEPDFLRLRDGDVEVTLGSLMEDVVQVPRLELDGIELWVLEKDGKANYQVILDNLAKLSGPEEEPAPDAPEDEAGKGYKIDLVTITDVTVNGEVLDQPVNLNVPKLEIKELGSDTPAGATLSQVQGAIIQAILKAVVEQGPQVLAGALGGALDQVGEIANVEAVSQAVGNVSEEAGQAIENVGKEADKIKEGLGGLLGGKKESEPEAE